MITRQQLDEAYKNAVEHHPNPVAIMRRDGTLKAKSHAAFAAIDSSEVKANPLFQRFIQYGSSFGFKEDSHQRYLAPITTAWQAEGERLFFEFMLGEPSINFDNGFIPIPEEEGMAPRLFAYHSVKSAVTYLWRNEILKMAESLPIPPHTLPEGMLPYPMMYWTYQGDRDTKITNLDTGESTEVAVQAELVWYTPPGIIQSGLLVDKEENGVPIVSLIPKLPLRIGSKWPDDYSEDEQKSLSPLLAKLSFLNSPYVENEKEILPRPIRREIARSSASGTEPKIHVVKLREESTPGGANVTGRKYKSKWWVRAHIRAQWFPSQKGHKLIWIREHLKGRSDSPMIHKIYDVRQ